MQESKAEIEKRIRKEQGIKGKIFWCDECKNGGCERRHCLDGPSTGCQKTFKPIPTIRDLGDGMIANSRPGDWLIIANGENKVWMNAEQVRELKRYLDEAF